jgi:hypothetical protein
MTYTNGGGMRGSTHYASNQEAARNFIYDTYVYLASPNHVRNIEMDTNQVWNASGDVLILGLQCAAGTWEFTTRNSVTGKTKWNQSAVACNPQNWTTGVWHHVQLITHTDGNGNAFYDSVILDGVKSDLNVSGFSSFGLNWPPGNLKLNFQLDGLGTGPNPITAYVDGMTMIWW